ncbi:hypothetical protein HYH02_015247 [Chlamydomonas schloesseri]|uniref:Homeobox domain-containing protein n=1 Tax=Chlamydomonas schloesseri TaxID=2026947 RepID=A0A835SIH4_9CHLO|nr:hypothetical protein HYH02_015247 [Chlamydomonas schloesseri]|eukprot:KAG2424068.1 hypothetical protein HYH02_015247 [Chlamydomonas schloesseri]
MATLLLLPLGQRALRRLLGPQVDAPTQAPARSSVVCNGRNDGASGGKRRRSSGSKPRRVDFQGPTVDDALWYEADTAPSVPSTSSSFSSRSPPAPSGSGSRQRAGSQQSSSGRRGRGRRDEDDEDEGDVRGWWEKPEERNLQSFAPQALEQWQEERLQLAYSVGRRKANIQELARELDLDRAVVLAWFKEFSLRPAGEREAILTARRGEDAARKAQQASRDAAEAATGQAKADARVAQAAAGANGAAAGSTGFIPFFTRKQLGADKTKRISGEALRTLESIYDRTPFPSADVVRGLYELHRLSRDVVSEWFAARRAADGITSSTQKRTARPSLRERDRDVEGAFAGPEEPAAGPQESASLLSMLGGGNMTPAAARAAGAPGEQPQQKPAEPVVVTLSKREMAALRSSLPSPNKYKGRQLAEKMGIKSSGGSGGPGGPGGPQIQVQIQDVQYVQEPEAAPEEVRQRLKASWRYRASAGAGGGAAGSAGPAAGGAGGRLRLRTRGGGSGGGGGGNGSGSGSDD